MITFQHKKEKAFCLKNESVFPGFIQQSGRGEVRRESVPNERTGGRTGERTGTDRNGSSSPLFSAFSRVLRLLRVSVTVKKRSCLRKRLLLSLQSQTKIVGAKTKRFFFSFSCSPCPSQSCLSRFSHQTLYPNIEGTRRHKSISLTETVVYRQLPLT